MRISPPVEAAHRDLSPLAWRFVRHAVSEPALTRRFDLNATNLPEWIRRYTYTLQSWPTFVGPEKLAEIRRAAVEVTDLVKSIPERVFRNDPTRFAAFYGLDNEAMAELLLEPPNGIRGAPARVDFVDSPDGLKVLETNIGAYLGGWQLRFWQERCLDQPGVRRFLESQGAEVRHRDPFRALFAHVAGETAEAGLADGGELNVGFGFDGEQLATARAGRASLHELFEEVLRELDPDLRGELLFGAYPGSFEVRDDRLLFEDGRRVHALLEYSEVLTPPAIHRCFRKGRLTLYSGPTAPYLGRKSSLGLLSELAGTPLFDERERELIEHYVPWSRVVRPTRAQWQGEEYSLPELLVARREEFVLKLADGKQGVGVHVGRVTPPEEWRAAVDRAVEERSWVAQERVESRPYMFQLGDDGCAPHDVVWGSFCFGRDYGGSFLRLQPRGTGRGVINSAQGATEGIVFEVTSPPPDAGADPAAGSA